MGTGPAMQRDEKHLLRPSLGQGELTSNDMYLGNELLLALSRTFLILHIVSLHQIQIVQPQEAGDCSKRTRKPSIYIILHCQTS